VVGSLLASPQKREASGAIVMLHSLIPLAPVSLAFGGLLKIVCPDTYRTVPASVLPFLGPISSHHGLALVLGGDFDLTGTIWHYRLKSRTIVNAIV
jgi:hypothetical protein